MDDLQELSIIEYDFSTGEVCEVSSPKDIENIGGLENMTPTTTESIAANIYKENGFKVKRLHNTSSTFTEMHERGEELNGLIQLLDEEVSKIATEFGNTHLWALDRSGCPDLLVYEINEDGIDYKFVEVKSTPAIPGVRSRDRLKHSQIDWITRFNFLSVKIAFVVNPANWDGFHEFS
ncbi:VRR-NUC domain-containing protein [Halorussus ruber]|uniref:VRR-NUC domain-containing protein n=1 Tax=Halorussus ruber TaxID=1126238 RepID=UPI00143D9236|nr:VRR-NUC domain-containing protein [Halorussus ruber]